MADLTTEAMDRVGVTRYAEGFATLGQCRQRFHELTAELGTSRDSAEDDEVGVCVTTLRPWQGQPRWVVALIATGALSPQQSCALVSRGTCKGQPIELPDAVWALLLVQAYDLEQERKGSPCAGEAPTSMCADPRGGHDGR